MESNSIHCTLTDAELAAMADQWIDELIASGGKSFTMQVPARPNKDTDLIFAELNNRFKAMLAEHHELKERCDKMADLLDEMKYYLSDLSSDDPVDVDMKKRDLSRINEAIAWKGKEVENG